MRARTTHRHRPNCSAPRWASWALSLALLGCGGEGPPGPPSCDEVCGARGEACADETTAGCVDACEPLREVIAPSYWTDGVGTCLEAGCTSAADCLYATAEAAPATGEDAFLHDLCEWVVTCPEAGGVDVDGCIAALRRVGDDPDDRSPWTAFRIVRASARECILSCYREVGCGALSGGAGSASYECLSGCGLAPVAGDPPRDPCESASCDLPHQTCVAVDGVAQCQCMPGWLPRDGGCREDCESLGCGDHGACVDHACECGDGYTWTGEGGCRRIRSYVDIVVSGGLACGLVDDGAIDCFLGENANPVPSGMGYTQLSASNDEPCALRSDGTIACPAWHGGIGGDPTDPPSDGGWIEIAGGHDHGCARRADGTVVCWGSVAQRHDGPGEPLIEIAVAGDRACGLRADRTLVCWHGDSTVPAGAVVTWAVGEYSICASYADASVVCEGSSFSHPVPADLGPVRFLATGYERQCGLHEDGSMQCWGRAWGPNLPPALAFERIGIGQDIGCGLTDDGHAHCWGISVVADRTPPLLAP